MIPVEYFWGTLIVLFAVIDGGVGGAVDHGTRGRGVKPLSDRLRVADVQGVQIAAFGRDAARHRCGDHGAAELPVGSGYKNLSLHRTRW